MEFKGKFWLETTVLYHQIEGFAVNLIMGFLIPVIQVIFYHLNVVSQLHMLIAMSRATHTIVGYMIYMCLYVYIYIYIIVSTFKYLIQYDKPPYGLSWFGLMDYWFCTLDKCIFKLDINKPTCG